MARIVKSKVVKPPYACERNDLRRAAKVMKKWNHPFTKRHLGVYCFDCTLCY